MILFIFAQKLVTLGEENIGTPVYAQVDSGQCFLMTEFLSRFALVGQSAPDTKATKIFRIVAFVPQNYTSMDYNVRVYILEDTHDGLEGVKRLERKLGGKMADKPKFLHFQDSGEDLCLSIHDLCEGWRSKLQANYQVCLLTVITWFWFPVLSVFISLYRFQANQKLYKLT